MAHPPRYPTHPRASPRNRHPVSPPLPTADGSTWPSRRRRTQLNDAQRAGRISRRVGQGWHPSFLVSCPSLVPRPFLVPRHAPPLMVAVCTQVELLEMQVETILVQRLDGDRTTKGVFDELRAWKKLFGRKYRDRTMVGVLIMVFQRTLSCCSLLSPGSVWSRLYVCVRRLCVVSVLSCCHGAGYVHVQCVLLLSSTMMHFIASLAFITYVWLTFSSYRMEWYQRSALLWANLGAQHRPPRGLNHSFGIGRHRHRTTPGRFTGHCVYRSLG